MSFATGKRSAPADVDRTAIDVDALPGDGPWQTREITHQAGQTTIQLANRQSADEVIDDIRSEISGNSERV